jgi:uncharacterized protein (DUF2141 family)
MRKKVLYLIFVLMLLFTATMLPAQSIEVTISGIRNAEGEIVIGVFKDNESFKTEKAFLSKKFAKTAIINGEMKVNFTLEPGLYGLSLLDDENSSGLMEYNFIGIPKEGFGFSDYYLKGITKPKFDAFSFTIAKDQTKKIAIRIRYI